MESRLWWVSRGQRLGTDCGSLLFVHSGTENTVWVGGTLPGQGQERTIVETWIHPQYNEKKVSYDFLILRLDEEVLRSTDPTSGIVYPPE